MAGKAESSYQCGICCSVFTNPLMLPCLHSFCKKCIELQLEEQGSSAGSIKCPTCDTVSALPSGGVASLCSNYWLAHQAEVSTYQQKIEDGISIPCDRCVKRTNGAATVFCCNCCLFLCSSCQEDHQWWRETVSHELVTIGEKKTGMDSEMKISRKPAMCDEHPKEELKFYCNTCQHLVCRDCIVIDHKEHSQSYLSIAAKREKEALAITHQEAEDAITKLNGAVTSRENMKKQVEDQKYRMNEMITLEFSKIYTALQEREKELHKKCEAIANQKLTVLTMEEEEVENLKAGLTFSTQISFEAQNFTPVELLSMKKSIQDHLQSRLTTFAQLVLEPGVDDKIAAVVDKTPVDEAISVLGNVSEVCDPAQCMVKEGLIIPLATVGKKREVKVAIKDDSGELVCEKVPMTVRLVAEDDGSVVPVGIRFENNGHALLSFEPIVVGEHKLTIKVMNRELAGSPYKIWSHQNSTQKSISSKQRFDVGNHSMGVTVHHNGDVFASNSEVDYIQVFHSDGSRKLQIGSSGRGDGLLKKPSGLIIVGEVLYVCDRKNHRVQKFTLTGAYIGQFGSYGSGKGQLNYPRGICTDRRGHILVADHDNNRVQIFTTDGAFVSSIDCGYGCHPYDVAVDNNGSIHVTLFSNNSIAVYSFDGQQIFTYREEFELQSPTGIVIDEEGYRYVASSNSNCICIFNPDGEFVTSFSCFSRPCCMTLDTCTGNIYVSSSGGKCVGKYY